MDVAVRTIEPEDVASWVACMAVGFLGEVAEGEPEYRLQGMDLGRTWGAFDGDRVVGTLRSFPTTLTLPGRGSAGAAALTNVTVAPTHRRRGLLTEMIMRDLERAHADHEALGILIAAEYPIYGRFGYGGPPPTGRRTGSTCPCGSAADRRRGPSNWWTCRHCAR